MRQFFCNGRRLFVGLKSPQILDGFRVCGLGFRVWGLGFRVRSFKWFGAHIWSILGLYGDNGKENGNYRDYIRVIGILMVTPAQDVVEVYLNPKP